MPIKQLLCIALAVNCHAMNIKQGAQSAHAIFGAGVLNVLNILQDEVIPAAVSFDGSASAILRKQQEITRMLNDNTTSSDLNQLQQQQSQIMEHIRSHKKELEKQKKYQNDIIRMQKNLAELTCITHQTDLLLQSNPKQYHLLINLINKLGIEIECDASKGKGMGHVLTIPALPGRKISIHKWTKGRDLKDFIEQILDILDSQSSTHTHHEINVYDLKATLADARAQLMDSQNSLKEQMAIAKLIKQNIAEKESERRQISETFVSIQHELDLLTQLKAQLDSKLSQSSWEAMTTQYETYRFHYDLVREVKRVYKLRTIAAALLERDGNTLAARNLNGKTKNQLEGIKKHIEYILGYDNVREIMRKANLTRFSVQSGQEMLQSLVINAEHAPDPTHVILWTVADLILLQENKAVLMRLTVEEMQQMIRFYHGLFMATKKNGDKLSTIDVSGYLSFMNWVSIMYISEIEITEMSVQKMYGLINRFASCLNGDRNFYTTAEMRQIFMDFEGTVEMPISRWVFAKNLIPQIVAFFNQINGEIADYQLQ